MHDNAPFHAARIATEYLGCFFQAWEDNAMASLLSRLKSLQKFAEHPEKEDLLWWKTVHLQE